MSQRDKVYGVDEKALVDFALRPVGEASPSGREGMVADLVAEEMG